MHVEYAVPRGASTSNAYRKWASASLPAAVLLSTVLIHPLYEQPFGLCLFKKALGIPCPACGMTRAFLFLGHGKFTEALRMNPNSVFAYFLVTALLAERILFLMTGKSVAIHFTKQERIVIYALSGLLVIGAWIYNLTMNVRV